MLYIRFTSYWEEKDEMIEVLNGTHETVIYRNLKGIRLYHNIENEDYPIHWHQAMEIIMPYQKKYSATVGESSFTLDVKDILIIPPGELHSLSAPPGKGERLIALLDFPSRFQSGDMDSLFPLLQPYMLVRRADDLEYSNALCACLSEVEREYFGNEPFAEVSVYSQLLRFFTLLGRRILNTTVKFPDIMPGKQHEYAEKFMAVCNYINDHCTENLTVEALAEKTGFSKFHFSRLFKQFTGMTCYNYLINKRISCAEKLLITLDLSVTEAAMQSGFNSLSTFNRIFKSVKGCTPSEYRQLNNHRLKLSSGMDIHQLE